MFRARLVLLAAAATVVRAACPDGWSTSASGKCFRLIPEPYNLRGDALPAFSECPARCGPDASLACLDSPEDVAFVAETLLCRGSPEEWQIPLATDTTLPASPGVCVAAFLGAYSHPQVDVIHSTFGEYWTPRVDPAARHWQCGNASSYDVSSIWGAEGKAYISSYTSKTAYASNQMWDGWSYYSMMGPHRQSLWRPTSQHRDWWYGHPGNVSMVFRAAPMNEASLGWRASDTQSWNTETPHAACLCEHTSHASGQTDVADQTDLHALLEEAQCGESMGRIQCAYPRLLELTLLLLALPLVIVICWWICCVSPWRCAMRPRRGPQHNTHRSHTMETGRGVSDTDASISVESVVFVSPLVAATRIQVMMRARVSGLLSLVGWLLVVAALIPSFLHYRDTWKVGRYAMGDPALYLTLLPWGATLLLLAVRPIDRRIIIAVRTVLVFCCALGSVSYFSSAPHDTLSPFNYGRRTISHYINAVLLMGVVLLALPLPVKVTRPGRSWRLVLQCNRSASATPRAQFGRLWIAFRLIQLGCLNAALLACDETNVWRLKGFVLAHLRCLLYGNWYAWSWGGIVYTEQAGAWYWQPTPECYFHVHYPTTDIPAEWGVYYAPKTWRRELPSVLFAVSSLLCFLSSYQGNRERVLRVLHRLLSPGDAESRAASIAALLGSVHPDAAFRTALSKFRAVPLSSLDASIFDTSADAQLSHQPHRPGWTRSRECDMGAVDAFISHAWRDDAATKVDRLKRWLPSLAADPLIWIDVACFDQSAIVTSLSCLPFFILGSKQFVGLVGPNYPTRLWCIMELFFFYELRPAEAKSCVLLDLHDTEHTQGGLLGDLDVNKAQCSADADHDFLLAIIESSFGSVKPFNKIVRSLMRRVEPMRADPRIATANAAPPPEGDEIESMLS